MNEVTIVDPKAISSVLVAGVWHDVIRETFHLTQLDIEGAATLWASAFVFNATASSEHGYASTVVRMSGPASSIQAIRTAT